MYRSGLRGSAHDQPGGGAQRHWTGGVSGHPGSNLAGGIQVLLSKPFKAGDYVEAGGISGTVMEVGLAYTKLCTVDNKVISVPNGQISGEKIINYSTEERRRVDLTFNASYDSPLQQVTGVLRAVVALSLIHISEPTRH